MKYIMNFLNLEFNTFKMKTCLSLIKFKNAFKKIENILTKKSLNT